MNFEPTNIPIENEYPKLVRDNIPNIIKNRTGAGSDTRILSDDREFLEYLLKKMVEESTELKHSLVQGNMQEELADVFELITTLLKLKNWSIEDIISVQEEKRNKNGGFNDRILMLKK
jgi:predicted house-cleaning noncanonical NTP pyrophosphatase (MazG superfamily)